MEQPPPDVPPPSNRPAVTLRAVLIGLVLSSGIAILAPINDWWYGNTLFYSQHLPVGVTLLAVLGGALLNPLAGRRRLRFGELVVVASMLLVIGGVVSSGLMRVLPAVIAGPARILPNEPFLSIFTQGPQIKALSSNLFVGMPDKGPIPVNDPEYRYVVNGYFEGLGEGVPTVIHRSTVDWVDASGAQHHGLALGGQEALLHHGEAGILDLDKGIGLAMSGHKVGETVSVPGQRVRITRIIPPGVPWYAWVRPFLGWMPLILGSFAACLAIAALVRRQWIEHERLPFPIAQVFTTLLKPPAGGGRLPDIYRSRGFWTGFAIAAGILATQGLHTWGLLPVAIPTEIDLGPDFNSVPWSMGYVFWYVFDLKIYFSIVGLTFFLPLELSFSLWFFFIATYVVSMASAAYGVPMNADVISQVGVGGYAMEAFLILWMGRLHYRRILFAALGRDRDPLIRADVPYFWMLVAGYAAMVGWLVLAGAWVGHAIILVAIFLGFILVLGRLVCEAGVPYLGVPNACLITRIIYSITGFSVPIAALTPLTLVGASVIADTRENLLPFALTAESMAHGLGQRRFTWSLALGSALLVATVVSAATMLEMSYGQDGHHDWFWIVNLQWQGLGLLANGIANQGHHSINDGMWLHYAMGAILVAVLGLGRVFIAAWPFHPLGYIASMTYPTWCIWFSFFVGWGAKAMVMRLGGVGVYRKLIPTAMGLISGEATAVGGFLVIDLIWHLLVGMGIVHSLPAGIPRFLPD